MDDPVMSALEAANRAAMHGRFDEAFPILSAAEVDRLRSFGQERRFAAGESLIETGRPSPGMFVVLSGSVLITARGPFGRVTPIVQLGPGQFTAELTALGRSSPALIDGHAQGEVRTILVLPGDLLKVLIAETELADRIMGAFVLRRKFLIENRELGPVLIGSPTSPDVLRLERFLARTGQPHHLLDPSEPVAARVIASYAPVGEDLPLVVCPNGNQLQNPTEEALARELGLLGSSASRERYDVAIVGAGPAGLSTAVYAASEGLTVALVDAQGIGGQAGQSMRIENYLGFPSGITGNALMCRAYAQARKFGVDVVFPVQVSSLEVAESGFAIAHGDRCRLCARSVVVATGARYRRPKIESLATFEGRGVWYWASPIEAQLCDAQNVIVVGGGNSAGQAAVFLAGRAAKVTVMVRGPALATSMSRYLIDRIAATRNIEVALRTEIVALEGSRAHGLEGARWRGGDGVDRSSEVRHVFVFAGAEPATDWLASAGVARDRSGFIVTGAGASPLESSVRGVFAVGDVRAGSVKRVGSAIGEGAEVVPALHAFLAQDRTARGRAA
ncbi:MAG TPA: FAD-dependent oxidoreductase [Planctomycetota bacterium]|nr:FAD-dependent oxidoreductase [Planctomycetota bacterium]